MVTPNSIISLPEEYSFTPNFIQRSNSFSYPKPHQVPPLWIECSDFANFFMSFKFPTVLETKLALYATWIRYEEIYENQ
jgi:hypothetical protein